MELLLEFFKNYGLPLGLIALAGVIVLSILKYCNVFEKIENETTRHLVYCACSVGLTLIGIIIYLLCTKAWDWTFFFSLIPVVWALNQTIYNIIKVTKLEDACKMLFDFLKKIFNKSNS